MNKRSGNDGCLDSLDLINPNKLLPNHRIYFTCPQGFGALPETNNYMVCYDTKKPLISSNKN
jgi:hypothetical protein